LQRLGKWKDQNHETGPIRQFVGIRSKMYSVRCENNKNKKKKKKKFNNVMKINGGCISKKQCGFQRSSRYRQYRRALFNNTRNDKEFWQIISSSNRSCIHDLNTLIVRKKTKKKKTKKTVSCSLNPIDCKRFVLPNCIDTLSYGHYSLR